MDYTVTVDGETSEFCNDAEFEQPPIPSSANEISTYNKTIFNFPTAMDKQVKITVLFRAEYYKPIDAIIQQATEQEMEVVIPPKKNRIVSTSANTTGNSTSYGTGLENAFLHLKRWRGIATRYAKDSSSKLAAVQIRCIALWTKIL